MGESSRVEVTAQKKTSSIHLKVTIDNHKYEVEVPKSGSQAIIRVNDEEKSYIKKQDYEKWKSSHQEMHSRKYLKMTKEQVEIEERKHVEKEQTEFTEQKQNYYQARPVYRKHLVEEKNNKICISAEQIRVCPSTSNPQEIEEKKVSFYCMSKDSQSMK